MASVRASERRNHIALSESKRCATPRIDYAAAVCALVFALVYVYFTMDSLQRASITGQRLTETSSSPAVRTSRIEHDVETKGTGSSTPCLPNASPPPVLFRPNLPNR